MKTRHVVAAVIAIVAFVEIARPFAQQTFTTEELTTSPYLLLHGQRDFSARIARHEGLAAIAEHSGDVTRAARHYALECQLIAALKGEAAMSAPSCARAQTLAGLHDIRDVKIQTELTKGVVRVWSFNFSGA